MKPTRSERPLTKRQQEVLDKIAWCIRKQGFPPTVRDLMPILGIRSPNGIMCHLDALEIKGRIMRTPGVSRGIVLVEPGQTFNDSTLQISSGVKRGVPVVCLSLKNGPTTLLSQFTHQQARDIGMRIFDLAFGIAKEGSANAS